MGPRIIICDDEVHITRAINMKLSRAGYLVESTCNGQEALLAIQRERPHLLITDCQMPVMDGIELCQTLRADPTTSALPIIMLTAKGYELCDQMSLVELNLKHMLVKPFSPRELLKFVQEICPVQPSIASR